MNWVKEAVANYVVPPQLTPTKVGLGKKRTFEDELKAARDRSRIAYWVCVAMLVVLFGVVLVVSAQSFDRLVELGSGGLTAVSGVFGISAASCVTLMMRWVRDTGRADVLLVLLADLRARDPKEFDRIVAQLARQWYDLKDAGPRSAPAAADPT